MEVFRNTDARKTGSDVPNALPAEPAMDKTMRSSDRRGCDSTSCGHSGNVRTKKPECVELHQNFPKHSNIEMT